MIKWVRRRVSRRLRRTARWRQCAGVSSASAPRRPPRYAVCCSVRYSQAAIGLFTVVYVWVLSQCTAVHFERVVLNLTETFSVMNWQMLLSCVTEEPVHGRADGLEAPAGTAPRHQPHRESNTHTRARRHPRQTRTRAAINVKHARATPLTS